VPNLILSASITTAITELQHKPVLPNLVFLTAYALVDGQLATLTPFFQNNLMTYTLIIKTFANTVKFR